jgi:hypothetical protein
MSIQWGKRCFTARHFLLVLCLSIGVAGTAAGKTPPHEILIPAKTGEIRFTHSLHQTRVASCEICHHPGIDAGPCRGCHGLRPEIPTSPDSFHRLCRGCHKLKGGPTTCKGCHSR